MITKIFNQKLLCESVIFIDYNAHCGRLD